MTDVMPPPAEQPVDPTPDRSVAPEPSDATGSPPDGDEIRSGWWRLALVIAAVAALGVWQGLPMLVVILSLVVMITAHEWGHYITAKRAGMKVTQFFVGFGPRIWSVQRGETEYGIRAIPAGAFVKVPGMLTDEEVDPADEARTYRRATYRQRVTMASAGSAMHFLMAIVLLLAQFLFFGQTSDDRWAIEQVVPGSAADNAGVQPGDRVLSVDGTPIETSTDLGREVRKRPGETVDVVVQRGDERVTLTPTLGESAAIIGTVGEDFGLFFTDDGADLRDFGGRASDAGLAEGDRIISVNGVDVDGPAALEAAASASKGGTLEVVYQPAAGGRQRTATFDLGTAVAATEPVGMIGTTSEYLSHRVGPITAVQQTASTFWDTTTMSIGGLFQVLNPTNLLDLFGRAATTTPDGGNLTDEPTPAAKAIDDDLQSNANRPISLIGSVSLATNVTEAGWGNLLGFLAMLNIFIGLFNLIPLLPFDGGHIAIATYERVRERMRGDGARYFIDPAKMYPVAVAVVAVLGLLFLSTMYLDVVDPIRI